MYSGSHCGASSIVLVRCDCDLEGFELARCGEVVHEGLDEGGDGGFGGFDGGWVAEVA